MRLTLLAIALLLCTAAAPPTTTIGGHTYAFPQAAFYGGQPQTGPRGDLLLELAWPELRPLTPQEAATWPKRATIRILANSGAQVPGAAVPGTELRAEMPKRVAVATNLPVRLFMRPANEIPPPRPDPQPLPPGIAAPGDGLQRVQVEDRAPGEPGDDVFVATPLDRPDRFVTCNRLAGSTVDPQCAEVFVTANLLIKASYRRPLLPEWRRIEQATIEFFQAHEVRP